MTTKSLNRARGAAALSLVSLVAALSGTSLALAGDLNPPSGTVAPTMKTLQQVEPRTPLSALTTPGDADSVFRITQPGSYYLTGNMLVPTGFHGIEIANSNITIDLMGYTITGQPGSKSGITTLLVPHSRVAIRNGFVRTMGETGIYLAANASQTAMHHSVTDVGASECVVFGIAIADGTITNCQSTGNGNDGIRGINLFSTVVTGCQATNNSDVGIRVSTGVITNSTAGINTGVGIVAGERGRIVDCVSFGNAWGYGLVNAHITGSLAHGNTAGGVIGTGRVSISDNTVILSSAEPGSVGVRVNGGVSCLIEGNYIIGQSVGVRVTGTGNMVIGNRFRANTSAMDVVAGNRVGTVVSTPSMGAVTGNSGGASVGTTDTNANLLF